MKKTLSNRSFGKILILAALLPALLFSGCFDKIELENRGFCLALSIDKAKSVDDGYLVSLSVPNATVYATKGGNEDNSSILQSAESKTFLGALHDIDAHSSLKVYLGQAKLVVFGEEVLTNKTLFEEAIAALQNNKEVSQKIIVMATEENAQNIINVKSTLQPGAGIFIANYYSNNKTGQSLAFKQDLGTMVQDLTETGNTIIPKITLDDELIEFGGAAIIKDFQLAGWLEKEEAIGYLWLKNSTSGMIMQVGYNNQTLPIRISKSKVKLDFEEAENGLSCTINVSGNGVIEEDVFYQDSVKDNGFETEISRICSEQIAVEINQTLSTLQQTLYADGLSLQRQIRKTDYPLYQKYSPNWQDAFDKMQFHINVNLSLIQQS